MCASWHEAARMWERCVSDQLVIEIESLPRVLTAGRPAIAPPFQRAGRPTSAEPSDPRTGAMLLSDHFGGAGRGSVLNNNGTRRTTCPGSAAGASQETS